MQLTDELQGRLAIAIDEPLRLVKFFQESRQTLEDILLAGGGLLEISFYERRRDMLQLRLNLSGSKNAQAIGRNVERLQDWDRRTAHSPLGAAALAGSAVCRSPELSARELGYDAPCENSIDAVAARDHVAEFLFVTSMLAVEISRLAEEVVLWSSRQFRWVELDDWRLARLANWSEVYGRVREVDEDAEPAGASPA